MPETHIADPEGNQPAHWRLRLCGRPQAVSALGPAVLLERRDAAMLALLAIEGPTSRERVIALLWPDEEAPLVRNRLRQRIFALKRKLGAEAVVGQLTLALAAPLQWLGLEDESHDKPLLGDDAHLDLPEFALWLGAVRERLQSARRERLAAAASSLETEGRLAEAIVAAEQLLGLEPLQEHAHRRLMRLHYLRGDRAAALLAFDRCEQVLKDEVGATPSRETLDLLAQIDRSQSLSSVAGAGARRVVPASVLRPPRLIGRDAEWARLQAAWERGEAIVVIGEAGMGKTRLVGDLVRAQAAEPGSALQVSARPGDERVPYALLSRMLRGLLAVRSAALAEGIESELARLLPELPQRAKAVGNNDAAAQARFVGAIETTLNEAVGAGLQAVVLDDLHFADAASLEMAQHLSAMQGLRWLTAFRGAEIGTAAQALVDTLTGRLQAEPIVLQPLSVGQVAELVESLGIEQLDAAALADALHQRSGGNPLFLLETLKALLLGGPSQGSTPSAHALAQLPAAGNVGRLIERRIGQLSREAVQLARCAAIAGQDFSASLASRVLDVNPLGLADAWLELESAQVLRDGAFAHDLIYEAARSSVPAPIARELHRRMAEFLQADRAAPARVAAHWLGADEELRAAPHLAEAGRLALRAMRIQEGVDYLDQAQSIYGRFGDADAQCSLIDELISPAVMTSSFDSVQRLVEQAANNASNDRQRSLALRSLTSLLAHRGEYERAHETGRQALAAALAARDRGCELGARALLAQLLGILGRAGEAVAMLRPIERWVNEHGSGVQRQDHAIAMASVLEDGGNLSQALDQRQRAIDIARSTGTAHALPILLGQRAITLMLTGRLQEARDAMAESKQLLHDIPDGAMFLRTVSLRLQVMDRSLGMYTSSLELGERVVADPMAGPGEVDESRLAHAFAFCDLGQAARARRLLEQARASAYSFNDVAWKEVCAQLPQRELQYELARREALDAAADAVQKWSGRSLLGIWRIQARHADDDEAASAARKGVEFSSTSGMRGQQLVFQSLLAQRLTKLGDTGQAVWLAKDSWRLMAEFNTAVVYRGVVWRALIEVLEPHDPALARTIVHTAADWIFRTAADHVPPAFRESFLHRNPANAFLLAKARSL